MASAHTLPIYYTLTGSDLVCSLGCVQIFMSACTTLTSQLARRITVVAFCYHHDFNSHVHVFRGELNSRQLFHSNQTSEFGFNIVRTG